MEPSLFTCAWEKPEGWTIGEQWIEEAPGLYLIKLTADIPDNAGVGSWQMTIRPTFAPTFYYTPHLTPENHHVVDMHVFRAPCLMMGDKEKIVCVLPVADGFQNGKNRMFIDLDAIKNTMTLGITTTRVDGHVLYRRTDEAKFAGGAFVFQARVMILTGDALKNPFRPVLRYYWERYGAGQCARLPSCAELMPYVRHTYEWAFERWKDVVWQEFEMNGALVGAPQMIVITRQSPNYTRLYGPCSVRESKAVWNQAWFSSLRSAKGLYRYGKMTGDAEYVRKALLTKELALQMPQKNGLFDAVIAVPTEEFTENGQTFTRGADWKEHYFGNSNRNPYTNDLRIAPKHVLDMSWTALQMLDWYEKLEQDERLKQYAVRYADRLLTLQDGDGFFPAWLNAKDETPLPALLQSPESAVSATLLLRLYRLTGEERYRAAALRCMAALVDHVMPDSRWEDFETYWSCSRFGQDMQGRKYPRNGIYKQCSLSPFYMAQALYTVWQTTGDKAYLSHGERCLDEMLMYQSAFQPDFMPITTVGGFGVMNGDCELNDQRQALFSDLIVAYGVALHRAEYVERGSAALRAAFSMMYCPENPDVKAQWEKKWPFLNELDYGFMMENYGHDGYADDNSVGIGEFTIYDWGNGAASGAVMDMLAHWPELFELGKNKG